MIERFNKGYPLPLQYPFTEIPPAQFEIDGSVHYSHLASPQIGKPHGLPEPTHYGSDGFFAELQEVIEVRSMVEAGIWPADFLLRHHPEPERFNPYLLTTPLINEGLTDRDPKSCADVVHMDLPMDMPNAVLRWLNEVMVPLKATTGHVDFLEAVPYVQEDIADATKRNLNKVFEAKYYFGRVRPEEALANVYQEKSMAIDCRSFTAYREGCPTHPAYPAGHAGAAAAVKVFSKHFELTEYYQDAIFDTAYLWSMFRTFAGVHYADDNLAGLDIGGLVKWNEKQSKWRRVW